MKQNILCVGETLMRFSTQVGTHFYDTTQLSLHYGGAEANVAINLSSLGHKTTYFTKVPDNQLGQSAIRHTQKYGVDASEVIYGGDRLGAYYLESGAGPRASKVIYDRAHSAIAEMKISEVDVDELLKGKTMLHITGVTAALSEDSRKVTKELMKKAHKKGVTVNFDVNYRSKLWSVEECTAFLKEVLPYVDYLSAGKRDAIVFFGVPEISEQEFELDYYYGKMNELYPNIKVFYSTLRNVISATHNTLQGTFWKDGVTYYSTVQNMDHIIDRVGGGDAFAAGVLHGILEEKDPEYTINFATAFSSLKHTVNGDVSPFSVEETEKTMTADASVER